MIKSCLLFPCIMLGFIKVFLHLPQPLLNHKFVIFPKSCLHITPISSGFTAISLGSKASFMDLILKEVISGLSSALRAPSKLGQSSTDKMGFYTTIPVLNSLSEALIIMVSKVPSTCNY